MYELPRRQSCANCKLSENSHIRLSITVAMATTEYERDIIDDKFRYQWSILIPEVEDLRVYRPKAAETDVLFRSPVITRPNRGRWQLEIRPYKNLLYTPYRCCFNVRLLLLSEAAHGMRVQMNCSILDEKSAKTLHTGKSEACTMSDHYKEVSIEGFSERCNLTSTLKEKSTLTFLFEVEVYKGPPKPNAINYPSPYVSLVMGTQLASAREEGLLTDFTFVVDGQELKAHKFVLAARSPVFRKMIEAPMRESQEASVTIDDFSAEVVGEMLTFLYSEKAPNIKEMVKELLTITDKYQIEDLKQLCGRELDRCLTIDNAAETLMLADSYNIEPLKMACTRFVAIHYPEVKETDDWATVVSERQRLYTEVLEEVCVWGCNEPHP